jgi:Domain of unknown function (DUF1707)/Domain of unknown function (DUF4190)
MTDCSVDPGLMRASDVDRDLAIADLRDACQLGRLTVGEFEARMHAALCSTTVGQLWSLTCDLPRRAQQSPTIDPAWAPVPWTAPANYYPSLPWGYGLQPPPHKAKMHPLAVTAFVLSLLGVFMCEILVTSIVAAILAVVALRQIDSPKLVYAGRGLTIAALAISASSVFLGMEILIHHVVH